MNVAIQIDKTFYSTGSEVELISLLNSIVRQEESAMRKFYRRTSILVYSLAYRILQDNQEAEELTLDVYNFIWENAKIYGRQKAAPITWLMKLTRTNAIAKLKNKKINLKLQKLEEKQIPSRTVIPLLFVEFTQKRKLIINALKKLNVEQRRAIELTYFQGFSNSEIAELLSVPLVIVNSWIRLGKRKLRMSF